MSILGASLRIDVHRLELPVSVAYLDHFTISD